MDIHGWCQDAEAMDAEGDSVDWSNPAACSFCAAGALRRSMYQVADIDPVEDAWHDSAPRQFILLAIREKRPSCSDIVQFNDDEKTNYRHVKAVFMRAIDLSEGRA